MNIFDAPAPENLHLTNWTAWGWLGGWATLLLAVLVGAVAVFAARAAYWKLGEGWWWLGPLAAVLWVASIWVLAIALSDLSRHSSTSQVAGAICLLGAVVSAAAFYPAIKAADTAFGDPYYSNASRLRFLVGAVPSVGVFISAITVMFSDLHSRGDLLDALFRLVIGIVVLVLIIGGILRVVSWANDRSSYRF
ncbi:hypothetical protein P3H15_45165 [Rhodococcus sp. T2V]|uniref:hypothetical protein n=1 Tax=Rhodococcus sp. T2V TaxID=3034164 RepID=UPI0023E1FFDC|nr:hypothetical protein [Rhodococcus sp. T2V]MDF3312164.1 hypothetical protein [Rhodococcus sp. T2V]